MIIYAVYSSDYEASWIKKAFVSKEKAEAYAQQIREGNEALANVYNEYHRRADEIWERVYDRNGFNDEPLFEELDAWYLNEKRKLRVPEECTHWDSFTMVEEVELEDYSSL